MKREIAQEQEVTNLMYENQLKKVKKELAAKQIESDKLANEISSDKVESQIRINELGQRKVELEKEISDLQLFQKTLIFNETQRIKSLAQDQINNTEKTHNQLVDDLKNQNAKLISMTDLKTQ